MTKVSTKDRIFQASMLLFSQHGYDGTSIQDICQHAEVSKGAFYHHFQSKFDLMVEIYRLGDVFFSERVPALLAQTNSLPAQAISSS